MNIFVFASLQEDAGKTSIITGIAKNQTGKFVYIKPYGDRLVYLKKRLWDYDAALITGIFGLNASPEEMSIGFEHSKLRFMYDREGIRSKLQELIGATGDEQVTVFIEGGKDLIYGSSVNMDAASVAELVGGKLVLVVSGDDSTIMDTLAHFRDHIHLKNVELHGVIINKINDLQDFREVFLPDIQEMGFNILGMIPNTPSISQLTVEYLAKQLFAKVIAGDSGLSKIIENVFVGAMSVNAAQRNPLFKKENKLIITSGDRSDMILAAIQENSSCIILTNNILPTATIISKASQKNIPLLVVPQDTYSIAMQVYRLKGLLTKDDMERISLLKEIIKEHVDVHAFE